MTRSIPRDPIAAAATAHGHAALAVIRTTGDGSIDLVARLFSRSRALSEATGNTTVYGRIIDPDTGDTVDEVVVLVYRAPAGYTGQDSAEIVCHGSPAGVDRILKLLYRSGFRRAEPGEFTLRAFLAGKMDLTEAEAVHEVVSATTARAHALAVHRLSGAVHRRIEEIKTSLVEVLSGVELGLDYPDDEVEVPPLPVERIDTLRRRIDDLRATYRTGRIYQEGALCALAGPTNAGKSSLFNLLLREERSIVSESHGTTRDYIEAAVSLDGVPVRFVDTAGLRSPAEHIEEEGIRRSRTVVEAAALVLYVVDATVGLAEEDRRVMESHPRFLGVWNKTDLTEAPAPAGFVPLSARTGEGVETLFEEVKRRVLPFDASVAGEPVIESTRQRELLDRASESLGLVLEGVGEGAADDAVALDLRDAVNALGEITGEVTAEDVLETMFSHFCVGK
ncbi:MAG: tRNA uridine-5-carboxymethylaminomethyl(34) synthesis GTPase MnmE [Spirochaetaceae bacterium]